MAAFPELAATAVYLNALSQTELKAAISARASPYELGTTQWLRYDILITVLSAGKAELPDGVTVHALASAIVDFQTRALCGCDLRGL